MSGLDLKPFSEDVQKLRSEPFSDALLRFGLASVWGVTQTDIRTWLDIQRCLSAIPGGSYLAGSKTEACPVGDRVRGSGPAPAGLLRPDGSNDYSSSSADNYCSRFPAKPHASFRNS